MATVGYVFLAREKEHRVPFVEQQRAIETFARSRGVVVEEIFIENDSPLTLPFGERTEGGKISAGLQPGDALITMQAESVLASAKAAHSLLQWLRNIQVSLYCIDLDEDISLNAERKLVVSEGGAMLVQKLLAALAACEGRSQDDEVREEAMPREEAKYLGGPVPFGYQVDTQGFLVPDDEQRRIILQIQKMREDRVSFRNIAKKLGQDYGIRLSSEGIRKIHKREQSPQVEV